MKLAHTILILTLFLVFGFTTTQDQKDTQGETTTYYFIRHAEKDRSDSTNKDPMLTKAGLKRAEQWAKILSDVSFDKVYSTDYKRTMATALPIATQNKLEILGYNPRDLYSDVFKEATKGGTVLVVGHSNTTPAFVNTVLGTSAYESIDDGNNGNLYIVTIQGDHKTSQLLHFN